MASSAITLCFNHFFKPSLFNHSISTTHLHPRSTFNRRRSFKSDSGLSAVPPRGADGGEGFESVEEEEEGEDAVVARVAEEVDESLPEDSGAVVAACLIGVLTGIGVVLFNNAVRVLVIIVFGMM